MQNHTYYTYSTAYSLSFLSTGLFLLSFLFFLSCHQDYFTLYSPVISFYLFLTFCPFTFSSLIFLTFSPLIILILQVSHSLSFFPPLSSSHFSLKTCAVFMSSLFCPFICSLLCFPSYSMFSFSSICSSCLFSSLLLIISPLPTLSSMLYAFFLHDVFPK